MFASRRLRVENEKKREKSKKSFPKIWRQGKSAYICTRKRDKTPTRRGNLKVLKNKFGS